MAPASRPPKKPRTVAQRYADYRRTFPRRANQRRLELIDKDIDGGGLTEDERAEHDRLTAIVDEWLANSPWTRDRDAMMAEREARFDELFARYGITRPPE